jgi:hypothetical protein
MTANTNNNIDNGNGNGGELAKTKTQAENAALSKVVANTAKFLMEKFTSNISTMTDQEVLDNYASTMSIDSVSWLMRTRLASEAYKRIKIKVTASFATGDIKKADGETAKKVKEICGSLNVGYAVFMYDVRMYERLFDSAFDNLEGIPAGDMVQAVDALKSRSYFAIASDCKLPRECVQTLTTLHLGGTPVTAKIANETKARLNAKADGRNYEANQASVKPKPIIDFLPGFLPTAHEELLCGLANAMAKLKNDPKGDTENMFVSILKDGTITVSEGAPTPTGNFLFVTHLTKNGANVAPVTKGGMTMVCLREADYNEYKAFKESKKTKSAATPA